MQEKIFYIEIDSLDNKQGCFASNAYFAEFFGISKTRVSLVIKSLIEKGYVKSEITYKEGTKEILNRVLNICYRPPLTKVKDPSLRKVKDPIQQKLKDNNTSNNTLLNNTSDKEAPNGALSKKENLISRMACDFDVAYSHLSDPKANSLNWGAAAAEKIRWTGKEIGNISHIRDALQKRMMDRGAEVTDENTLKNWRMFLEMAIGLKDDFLNRNFTPSILYSQFNSIVLKLNQNRNGAKFNKPITIISDETKRAAFQELIDEGYFDNQRTY